MLVGLVGWAGRTEEDSQSVRHLPPFLEAVLGGAAVGVATPLVGVSSFILFGREVVASVALLVLAGGGAWWAAAALHGRWAPSRRGSQAIVGIVPMLASGFSWGSTGWPLGLGALGLVPLLSWPVATAAVILGVRAYGGRRLSFLAGGAVAAASGLVASSIIGSNLLPAYSRSPEPVSEADLPQLGSEPTRETEVPAGTEKNGAEEPPLLFGDLCHPSELTFAAGMPVPGGHEVAATVTITSTSDRSCLVGGWPSVRLTSDGEDLALFLHVATVNPTSGQHVVDKQFTLEPGESGETQIWWQSNGAAADLEAEQVLYLGIGGGEGAIPLPQQGVWDVVRGSEAWLAPWQPVSETE